MRPRSRLVRSLVAAGGAILVLTAPRVPARAQTEAGDVVVTVADAASGIPLRVARVVLVGSTLQIGYTDAQGRARFESLPSGTYRAQVTKSGYRSAASQPFDVVAARESAVRVRLARRGLRTIGSVTVTTNPLEAMNEVGQSDPLRFLDGSLQAALGSVPGVTASGDGYALDGNDPAQTGFSIDGVPIPAAGGSLANGGINGDLFSSASVNPNAQNGALGGTIGFLTLNPTRSAQSSATLQYAGTNASAATLTTRGSIGTFGYVAEHVVRGQTSPLDGLDYRDTSGLDYVHHDDGTAEGDLAKMRWSPSLAESLSATYISTNASADLGCNAFASLVPCGYGPGNGTATHSTIAVLNELATIGATTLTVGAATHASTTGVDEDQLEFAGVPEPSALAFATVSHSASFALAFPAVDKHEFAVDAVAQGLTVTSTAVTPLARASAIVGSSYHGLALTDTIRPDAHLSLVASAGINGSNGASDADGSFAATWQPAANDLGSLRVAAGDAGQSLNAGSPVPSPASLTYFCGAGEAVGMLAANRAPRQRSNSTRGRYEHSFRHARIGIAAWSERLLDAPVTTAVDGADVALPPGFVNVVTTTAQSPDLCGPAARTPALTFLTAVPADQVDRGATLSGSWQFGARSLVAAYDSVQSRYVTSIGAPYAGAGSLVPNFAQVPLTPLHRAGLVAAARLSPAVDALANVDFTSANNPNGLPAYALVNAGFAVKLRYGSLALVGNNLTNRYADPFATVADGVPLARVGATAIPMLGQPLAPRTLTATYTVRIGNLGAAGNGAQARDVSSANADDDSSAQMIRAGSLPEKPPAGFPAIDPDNDRCTVTAAHVVQPVLDALAAIAHAADDAKRENRYSATLSGGMQRVNGVDLAYRRYDDGLRYAITLGTPSTATFFALTACVPLVGGSPADEAAHHLFQYPEPPKGLPALIYSPLAGIYLQLPAPQPGMALTTHALTLEPEPATAPRDPFALRAACPAAAKPLAELVVESVRTVDAGGSVPAGDDLTFAVQGSGAGRTVSIAFRDPLGLTQLYGCLVVSGVSREHLRAAGLSPPHRDGLAFARRFGFYVLAPGDGP